MVTIHNLSGSALGLDVNGQSYILPDGISKLSVPDGSEFTVTFNNGGGSGPPPPPGGGGNTFTEYGTLSVWEDSFQYTPAESPLFFFMEGMILGVLVFGTAYILRIIKNVARQNPEV